MLGLSISGRARHVRRAAGPAEDAPAASFAPPAGTPPPRPTARTWRGSSAAGSRPHGHGRGVCAVWSSAPPGAAPVAGTGRLSESRMHSEHFARLDVSPSSAEKEPERTTFIRRTDPRRGVSYTRRFYSRQRDSMDIRYRALWISRVDGASSMPDGAHWLAQSRSPQTPSRRAGCGSLMWAALSMSICVIIRGGVLRLAAAAAAAVA